MPRDRGRECFRGTVQSPFVTIPVAVGGFEETVASPGPAITDAQAHIIVLYIRDVYLVFDLTRPGAKPDLGCSPQTISPGLASKNQTARGKKKNQKTS